MKILVVEDDPNMRRAIAAVFKKAGHQIFEAEDGNKGLEIVQNESVEIVFSDIMMPNLNGLEFLKKAKEFNPFLEVIMITANSSPLKTLNSIEFGACDFLRKPFTIDELRKALEIALESRQRKKGIMLKGSPSKNRPAS